MENKFLIQINGMEKNTLDNIFTVFKRMDFKYETFETISKQQTITNKNEILKDNFNLITIGGVSFLRMLNYLENKLSNSVDYSIKEFDQAYYSQLDLPLLNKDASIYKFNDIKNHVFEKDIFVKPSKDIKSFNGGILLENETLLNYLYRTGGNVEKTSSEDILIAPLKKIYYEYRFFIHNNEILGCSRYVWNNQYSPSNIVPDYIKEKAIEYSKLYNPQEIYVMDLAETDMGIFIVEYQCWNISAFYESDLYNLLGRINEIKNKI